MCRCRQGHLAMVMLLLKCGADPSLIDGEGFSSIHLAVLFQHMSIIAYLIAKGQVCCWCPKCCFLLMSSCLCIGDILELTVFFLRWKAAILYLFFCAKIADKLRSFLYLHLLFFLILFPIPVIPHIQIHLRFSVFRSVVKAVQICGAVK